MNLYDILLAKKLGGGSTPAPTPVLIDKTITANGVYNAADDDADGYSSVDVQVPAPPSSFDLSGNVTVTGTTATGIGEITLNIPNSVTSIDNNAFSNITYITSVTISNSVTSIGNNAFNNCSEMKSVTLSNNVTQIGNTAFSGCKKLPSITIPNSVTNIGTSAFAYCEALTSVIISNSVTSIKDNTFRNCVVLPSITIPNSVTSIGTNAFLYCVALTSITCEAINPPTIQANTFNSVPADCAIYVPAGSVDAYKAANYWNARAAYIQAIPG